jgi:UDP-N-acetylmuramyl pentapeptide phosphotransferase/UDP-N-acetylglucosamine-1-phosphate transferase
LEQLLAVLIGSGLILIFGLVRDVRGLSCLLKLSVEIAACLLLIGGQVKTQLAFLNFGQFSIGGSTLYFGNVLLTMAWVLVLLKIFDILEEFDGVVVGTSLIASLFLFLLALWNQDYTNAFFALIFAGSLLGVLWEHLSPPTLLLGKAGSGFIAFLLASLCLSIDYSTKNNSGFVIPVFLLTIPLAVGGAFFVSSIFGDKIYLSQIWKMFERRGFKPASLLGLSFSISTVMGFASLLLFSLTSSTIAWTVVGIGFFGISFLVLSLLPWEVQQTK